MSNERVVPNKVVYKNVNSISEMTDVLLSRDLNFTTFQLKSFALVVKEQGLSVSELQSRTGFNKTTAARVFRTLSTRESPRKEGHCLIELITDEDDYRVRRAWLTEKGRELAVALGLLTPMEEAGE